jgi:hypothetical protein
MLFSVRRIKWLLTGLRVRPSQRKRRRRLPRKKKRYCQGEEQPKMSRQIKPQDTPLSGAGKEPRKEKERCGCRKTLDDSVIWGELQPWIYFGRRRMLRAEAMDVAAPEQHVLAREQFGSRKHRKSITRSAWRKRLTFDHLRFDHLRQLWCPGALCASGLKSCYDRVVHSMASLFMRRVGMPFESITCMLPTIQDLWELEEKLRR